MQCFVVEVKIIDCFHWTYLSVAISNKCSSSAFIKASASSSTAVACKRAWEAIHYLTSWSNACFRSYHNLNTAPVSKLALTHFVCRSQSICHLRKCFAPSIIQNQCCGWSWDWIFTVATGRTGNTAAIAGGTGSTPSDGPTAAAMKSLRLLSVSCCASASPQKSFRNDADWICYTCWFTMICDCICCLSYICCLVSA